jgi:hypothetical protein
MSPHVLPPRRPRAADVITRRRSRLERHRVPLAGGVHTTLHVAGYELRSFRPRVAVLEQPDPLIRWCRRSGIRDAVVGGFFIRSRYEVLGDLQIGGETQPTVPFAAPWNEVRATVHVHDGQVTIAARNELPPSCGDAGDLLQAGPLLVAGGRRVVSDGDGREGFSVASHQFDSDITAGRYPRAALALAGDRLLAVACDGRTADDAGMTLPELADALLELGASDALNLDGGGSASLVYAGRLRNRPREEHGMDLLEGRPILTAIVLEPL